MAFDLLQAHGARRLEVYIPPTPLVGEPAGDDEPPSDVVVDLDYERLRDRWASIDTGATANAQAPEFAERPLRFVDGKDVGETIAWLRAPAGYPVPLRLSQIGAVVMRADGNRLVRERFVVEQVVTLVADVLPTSEVERFARALQPLGLRFLAAQSPDNQPSYDFEKMRKAAQNRSNDEMGVLEEAVLAAAANLPTFVDGRLEPRQGGFTAVTDPVFGVVKTQRKTYLHGRGMQVLFDLEVGQRSPVFALPGSAGVRLPVVSWYVRLTGSGGMPNWGIVRLEVAKAWFEQRGTFDRTFVDQLSTTVFAYRCRERSYGRAAVSMHPTVRAEESLGACFAPLPMLTQRFYRMSGL